ncbi:MAG: preprotein translocase subunit SecA [Patescibacteria group bacterium]
MSVLTKIFGSANEKYLKKLNPIVDKINDLEKGFESFSDEDLKKKTIELKERLHKETLKELLPEAFALVREASKRTLNQRHYNSQLIGGIVLAEGKIAEMKTGEGKTLAATLPIYLHALEGKGCHLITVNDYLARRDAIWMGQIYVALGFTIGCINHEQSFIYDPDYKKLDEEKEEMRDELGSFYIIEDFLRPVTRREAYAADITYGTNNEFGFDYLRDNMVQDLAGKVQRDFNFCIIDEVDSVLIDEARTPLIISSPDEDSSKWYREFAQIIPQLKNETDFEVDEKLRSVVLTEDGVKKIEGILKMDNIYEDKGIKYLHYLEQALKAENLFKKDKDYVVKNGEIIIVDEFTGRLMPGRRWSKGLHQAVEAKEGVAVQAESLTLASITFQNFFNLYKKLSGMTGTALSSAEELDQVYGLDVIAIPTNKPLIRKALKDVVFKNKKGKDAVLIQEIKERHGKGQPILIGTRSVTANEKFSQMLQREGIIHQVLNAKNHKQEGEIIAQAGKLGAVTVATNMAGRGVDIVLGGNPQNLEEAEKIKELGGLHVIGTERHEARRIDNQLRGRSGRQGDPGSSQFYLSLEDDLMRIFGGEKVQSLMSMLKIPDDEPIDAGIISKVVEASQAKIEGFNFDLRKRLLEYDNVLNKHREVIYKKRNEILSQFDSGGLRDNILEIIERHNGNKEEYYLREKEVGEENMKKIEKMIFLKIIDTLWIEHLENMDYIRDSVKLRAYGKLDPLVEYKREGHKAFSSLLDMAETGLINTILKAQIKIEPKEKSVFPFREEKINVVKSVGRNDPCPCGSGKKYKKCCWPKFG